MLSEQPKPHKKDKGKQGGSCNRSACQKPKALYFNKAMRAWYCKSCALDIHRGAADLNLFPDLFEKK